MQEIVNENDIRSIILNADKIKKDHKCKTCDGTGFLNWNEDGEDIQPGKLKKWVEERTDGICEECQGIGYLDVFQYVEI